MGACASAEPFDFEAYYARIVQNLSLSFTATKMPMLIIIAGETGVFVDGGLPDAVMTEFGFEPDQKDSTKARAKQEDCPSPALLLAALKEQHGWTLFSACYTFCNRFPYQHFVLEKAPTAA